MNGPASIDGATKPRRSESDREIAPFALWPWIFVAAIVVFLVAMSDPSSTGDPRIALFQQGGLQP